MDDDDVLGTDLLQELGGIALQRTLVKGPIPFRHLGPT